MKKKKDLPLFIKRRFTENELESEFEEALDYSKGLFVRIFSRYERTLENYINLTIRVLIDNLHATLTDTIGADIEWYKIVEDSLKDYYRDRITDEYQYIE